jgi:nucleotide-binding universal stress UspA family protein
MFKTIIWATDGSEVADGALRVAEEIARVHGSRIVAVHGSRAFYDTRYNGGSVATEDDELEEKIRGQVDVLRARGYDVELALSSNGLDDVPHLIARAAERHRADLIVVGTHGRGAIPSALFGGIAKQLPHLAACPVLVVPLQARPVANGLLPRVGMHSQDVSSL